MLVCTFGLDLLPTQFQGRGEGGWIERVWLSLFHYAVFAVAILSPESTAIASVVSRRRNVAKVLALVSGATLATGRLRLLVGALNG